MAGRPASGDRVKESVTMTAQTGSAARITVQSLFRRYEFLAGMTGPPGPPVGNSSGSITCRWW